MVKNLIKNEANCSPKWMAKNKNCNMGQKFRSLRYYAINKKTANRTSI
jgi:hypothetical protein